LTTANAVDSGVWFPPPIKAPKFPGILIKIRKKRGWRGEGRERGGGGGRSSEALPGLSVRDIMWISTLCSYDLVHLLQVD
jgi:hypothetical protein